MRDLLNAIMDFIGAESLTDAEWMPIDQLDLATAYGTDAWSALDTVLKDREAVSTMRDRLKAYYAAKGVQVEVPTTGLSNIFVGSAL